MLRREDYVRPPVVATEPPSARAAVWRFRVVTGLLLLALGLTVLLLLLKFANVTEEDPGFGIGMAPVSQAAAAP